MCIMKTAPEGKFQSSSLISPPHRPSTYLPTSSAASHVELKATHKRLHTTLGSPPIDGKSRRLSKTSTKSTADKKETHNGTQHVNQLLRLGVNITAELAIDGRCYSYQSRFAAAD